MDVLIVIQSCLTKGRGVNAAAGLRARPTPRRTREQRPAPTGPLRTVANDGGSQRVAAPELPKLRRAADRAMARAPGRSLRGGFLDLTRAGSPADGRGPKAPRRSSTTGRAASAPAARASRRVPSARHPSKGWVWPV